MSRNRLLLPTTVVGSLLALAGCRAEVLSAPESWNGDFTRLSPPTAQCPGGTLTQLRARMAVSGPFSRAELESRVPEALRAGLKAEDRLYSFWFGTDPDSENYWGFNGHLVSRADCIVHVEPLGYDN